MWLTFLLGLLFCSFLLYVPGCIQARALNLRGPWCIVAAPLISFSELCITGIVFGLLGISVSWAIVFLPLVLLSVLAAFFIKKAQTESTHKYSGSHTLKWGNIALYMIIGLGITFFIYVKSLDGPNSFLQYYDNAFHLNLIHAFVESGRFSCLQATTDPSIPLEPFSNITFYPAGWHVLTALCANALDVSEAMAENIVNTIFLGTVFPISVCAFVSLLFKNTPKAITFGSIIVLAFAAFPWGFLVAGPLYSNLAAYAFLPAVIAIFIETVETPTIKAKISFALIFVLGGCSLGLAQPNAIFTAIVILTPYCVVRIYSLLKLKFSPQKAIFVSVAFLCLVLAIWTACRHISLFAGVVNYSWTPYAPGIVQGMADFLNYGFRNATEQQLLMIFSLIGLVYALCAKQCRWLIFSYAFLAVAFLSAGVTENGIFGTFFSGYWYNDVDRIAASSILVVMPFTILGLYGLVSLLTKVISVHWSKCNPLILKATAFIIVVLAIYTPNHILAGQGYTHSAIGDRIARLDELAVSQKCLTEEEIDFVEQCNMICAADPDTRILNYPFDGSVYTYAINNTPIMFRHFTAPSNQNLDLLSEKLANVQSDPEVQKAVRDLNVKYVLLLDSNGSEESLYTSYLNEKEWVGLTSITDNTPGFNIVLSEGDMRLYEIDLD